VNNLSKILILGTLITLMATLSACEIFQGKTQSLSDKRSSASKSLENSTDVNDNEVQVDHRSDGVTVATFKAGSNAKQKVSAGSGSAVAGSSAEIPAGALIVDTEISINEAADLNKSEVYQALGIDESQPRTAAKPVVFISNNDAELQSPMTIMLPVPDQATGLVEVTSSIIVLFHNKIAGSTESKIGVIPSSQVKLVGNKVEVAVMEFGVYQSVRVAAPVAEKKSVVVTYPPKIERKAYSEEERAELLSKVTVAAATVQRVQATTTNGAYTVGSTIFIKVTFSSAVTVTGTPQLLLKTGTTNRSAIYASGSGSAELIFSYAIQNGDSSAKLDYVAVDSLTLNGGSINYATGKAAELNLPAPDAAGSLGANSAIAVDTTPPTFTSISLINAAADGVINSADATGALDLVQSPVGSGFDAVGYKIVAQGTACTINLIYSATKPKADSSDISPTGNYAVCVKLTDAAGNVAFGVSSSFTAAKTNAVVNNVDSTTSNGVYTTTSVISIRVHFSKIMTVTGTPKLLMELGSTDRDAVYTSGSGTSILSFSYNVQSGDNSSDLDYVSTSSLSLNGGSIADADGNAAVLTLPSPGAAHSLGDQANIAIDTLAPSFSSLSLMNDAADGYINYSEATASLDLAGNLSGAGYDTAQYAVVASGIACSTVSIWGAMPKNNSAGITSDGSYKVCVKLTDNVGLPAAYGQSATIVRDTQMPTFVGIKELMNISATEAWIFWEPATDNQTLSKNMLYQVCKTEVASGCSMSFSPSLTIGPNATDARVTGLTAGVTTEFVVRAKDEAGNVATNTLMLSTKTMQGIVRIETGFDHTCAIVSGGAVKCWGSNINGQLGDGSYVSKTIPFTVTGLTGVTDLALGYGHSCALMSSGSIKCWGLNASGQLGDGSIITRTTPVPVSLISTASTIDAGMNHTCALLTDNSVYCWGSNVNGQLGDYSNINRNQPVMLSSLSTSISVATGHNHTCAILQSGSMKCWGLNSSGQLGIGSTASSNYPVAVNSITDATKISAGGSHTCASLASNTVKCWGGNSYGQIGDNTNLTRTSPTSVSGMASVSSISAGNYHVCAVLTDSTVKCWGQNFFGQLGDGTSSDRTTPTAVTQITGADAVSLGANFSCARLTNGTSKCWGDNSYGQRGHGAKSNRNLPTSIDAVTSVTSVVIGQDHRCVVVTGGAVKCWGKNTFGQLGNGSTTDSSVPVQVPGLTGISKVTLGLNHTCALEESSGNVKCWGLNNYGQLGNGTNVNQSSPIAVSGLTGQISLASGMYHSCAVHQSGVVKCWGYNNYGQLGDGTSTTSSNSPVSWNSSNVAVSVSAGEWHSCAVRDDGFVNCWGYNALGQLGNASITNSSSPVTVESLSDVSKISLGSSHSCALLSTGAAKCWGHNAAGQIGDGTVSARNVATPVLGITSATAIAVGSTHSCALLSNGTAKCWGSNSSGQIGAGSIVGYHTSPVEVSGIGDINSLGAGEDTTCAVLVNSSLRCWGHPSNSGPFFGPASYANKQVVAEP